MAITPKPLGNVVDYFSGSTVTTHTNGTRISCKLYSSNAGAATVDVSV